MKIATCDIVCFCLVLSLASGCENIEFGKNARYSGGKDNGGNYIVLDTRTGSVSILQNGQLVKIPSEESTGATKSFKTNAIPGFPIQIAEPKIKFRNGRLLYRGEIKYIGEGASDKDQGKRKKEDPSDVTQKMLSLWESQSGSITMLLLDTDGFNVSVFDIREKDLYTVVDMNGEPTHLAFEGETNITPKDYEAIDDYTFTWTLPDWEKKKK